MAWFVYNEDSARALRKNPELKEAGVKLEEGNPLVEALARKESVLLLPGTEAPFLLHIQNRRAESWFGEEGEKVNAVSDSS